MSFFGEIILIIILIIIAGHLQKIAASLTYLANVVRQNKVNES